MNIYSLLCSLLKLQLQSFEHLPHQCLFPEREFLLVFDQLVDLRVHNLHHLIQHGQIVRPNVPVLVKHRPVNIPHALSQSYTHIIIIIALTVAQPCHLHALVCRPYQLPQRRQQHSQLHLVLLSDALLLVEQLQHALDLALFVDHRPYHRVVQLGRVYEVVHFRREPCVLRTVMRHHNAFGGHSQAGEAQVVGVTDDVVLVEVDGSAFVVVGGDAVQVLRVHVREQHPALREVKQLREHCHYVVQQQRVVTF